MFFYGIENPFSSSAAMLAFEIALFIPGVIGLVIFAVRLSREDRSLRQGIFERDLSASDGYASHPISSVSARRLFLAPSMVIFLAIVALELIFLMLVNYGILKIPTPY